MTPYEHYREAERVLAAVGRAARDGDPTYEFDDVGRRLAEAQVHATLALFDQVNHRAAGYE